MSSCVLLSTVHLLLPQINNVIAKAWFLYATGFTKIVVSIFWIFSFLRRVVFWLYTCILEKHGDYTVSREDGSSIFCVGGMCVVVFRFSASV